MQYFWPENAKLFITDVFFWYFYVDSPQDNRDYLMEKVPFSALRCSLHLGAEQSGLKSTSIPHDFRPALALVMLRNSMDIFALQKLMGRSDLQILRRYLVQTDGDIRAAHMRGSPVDGNL